MGWILTGNAQAITESAVIIDAAEDTTQVNTINDIVVMQEKVSSRNILMRTILMYGRASLISTRAMFHPR